MNKNWLYRVLAMALIVMMAMPFAMAEEVQAVDDVQANAVEEVVESNDIALGEVAESVKSNDLDETLEDYDGLELDMYKKNAYFYVTVEYDQMYKYKEFKVSSSNKKVATISKGKGGVLKITLKGDGEATLTAKYKYKASRDDDWSDKQEETATITVNDKKVDAVAAWYDEADTFDSDDWEDFTKDDDAVNSKKTISVDKLGALDDVVVPFAVNNKGDNITGDYCTSEDADIDYLSLFDYKWSAPKVMDFDGDNRGEDVPVGDFAGMTITAHKPGKSNLTLTHVASGKKLTLKFKVEKLNEYKGDKAKKKDGAVSLAVKKAAWKDEDTIELTISCYNGLGETLDHKRVKDVSVIVYPDSVSDALSGTVHFKKDIKSKKWGEGTMEVDADFFDLDDVSKLLVDVNEVDGIGTWIGDKYDAEKIVKVNEG